MRRLLAVLLLCASSALGQQWGQWVIGPGAFGNFHWRPPVANLAALPATGNSAGDVRLTLDSGDLYWWSGSAWALSVSVPDCTDAQVLGGTVGGTGVECQADDDVPEAGDFGALALTGDVTSVGLATTIAADSVALGTDTTGGYAAALTEGGAATTATALAANAANCGAGEAAAGVDAAGAAEGCFVAGVSDHGALTGLTDDDHSQYALLAGRSGGQSISGGTAASENLTLNSTAHATKGYLSVNGFTAGVGAAANNELFLYSNGVTVLEMYGAVSPMIRNDGQYTISNLVGVGGAAVPDVGLKREAAGILGVTNGSTGAGALRLLPLASPPAACAAGIEGAIYSDTSHALCWCDGTSWTVLAGAGSCA